jgi:hypothetical protein
MIVARRRPQPREAHVVDEPPWVSIVKVSSALPVPICSIFLEIPPRGSLRRARGSSEL